MNVTIDELMVENVVVARPDDTVEMLRDTMAAHSISAMPVADAEGMPLGIITTTDLLADHPSDTPVTEIMSSGVKTVARYDQPHIAARVMRNHRIHHVVVTHEKKIVGILSTYDLLRLVEDHRFTMKNAPTAKKHTAKQRG